jgi:hypothetical protein
MTDITTELNEAVAQGRNLSDAWNELMRTELEHCVNGLLQSKFTVFLDYDK